MLKKILIVLFLSMSLWFTSCTAVSIDTPVSVETPEPKVTIEPTAAATPSPTTAVTPFVAATPEPLEIPTTPKDMEHYQDLDFTMQLVELSMDKGVLRDMTSDEYAAFLDNCNLTILDGYEGKGRISESLSYIALTRQDDTREAYQGQAIDIIQKPTNNECQAYYVVPTDVIVIMLKDTTSSHYYHYGLDFYCNALRFDDTSSIEYLIACKERGLSNDYKRYPVIFIRDLRHGTLYYRDFDFKAYKKKVDALKGTVKRPLSYVGVEVKPFNTSDDIPLSLDPDGRKVVAGHYSDELFDEVADLLMDQCDWYYESMSDIHDIQKATLQITGQDPIVLKDKSKLQKLEDMIQGGFPYECDWIPYSLGSVTIELKSGKKMNLLLDYSCEYIILGSYAAYHLGGENPEVDLSREFGQLFGIDNISNYRHKMCDLLIKPSPYDHALLAIPIY